MRIAVLGGGNGSFAAAGDFALAGHVVRLWRRDAAAVADHKAAGSRIQVKNAQGTHDTQLALVTTDIAEAIKDVELILCPAPAFAQPDIARRLAPHLADGQVVYLPPATFGSMIFAKAAHDAGNTAKVAYAETERQRRRLDGSLREDANVESMYFISTLPWLHYSALIQPVAGGEESNPRITWGAFAPDAEGRLQMPVTLLVHHWSRHYLAIRTCAIAAIKWMESNARKLI